MEELATIMPSTYIRTNIVMSDLLHMKKDVSYIDAMKLRCLSESSTESTKLEVLASNHRVSCQVYICDEVILHPHILEVASCIVPLLEHQVRTRSGHLAVLSSIPWKQQ